MKQTRRAPSSKPISSEVRHSMEVNGRDVERTQLGLLFLNADYQFKNSNHGLKKADAWALSRRFNLEQLGLSYRGKLDLEAFGRVMTFVPEHPNGIRSVNVSIVDGRICLRLQGAKYSKGLQENMDNYARVVLPVLMDFAAKRKEYVSEGRRNSRWSRR